MPVQDEYAAEAPVPVAEAPHEPVEVEPVPQDTDGSALHADHEPEPDLDAPVARVADPWPAEQDEKLSIHEVYRQ